MGILDVVSNTFYDAGVITWDVFLTLGNLVRFSRPVGAVTPAGHPGYGGHWPAYEPPKEGDSRCSCPALNTMANHGIIARSGRGIKFTDLTDQIRTTYNFAPTFCSFVPHYAARMLKKNYGKDTFDLGELDVHNGIEHDASLTRLDTALQPNQSIKYEPFLEELLSFATGKSADGNPLLTEGDMSRISGKRRAEAKATNKDYSLSFFHKIFGSTNTATMLAVFGGRVDDLRAFLFEERLREGWESRAREAYGLTITKFNVTILSVELGIRESDWTTDAEQITGSQAPVAGKDP